MENVEERFVIDNDNTADWAVQKIAEEEAERDRLIAICDNKIEELQSKKEKLISHCDSNTGFLKMALSEYFSNVPHKETKTQESYKLISGSLIYKKPTQKIVHDDEKLIAYLKETDSNEFIKIKESVNWADYKKELTIVDNKIIDTVTGMEVEACSIEDVPASFNVKVNKED